MKMIIEPNSKLINQNSNKKLEFIPVDPKGPS